MAAGATRRVVVMGHDAAAVAAAVRWRRESGARVAGFVGDDERAALEMGEEMLGGVDELVSLDAAGAGERPVG